jgi:dTDP-4-amino-4,6-dideoxygalactose transaminase
MKPIKMVDLHGQYLRIKTEIDAAIQGVLDSTAFVKGPDIKAFENELAQYLGVKRVVACGNGTDALQIALMALGLKPGDEVITPAFTFISTVEVAALLGFKPVFADVEPGTFNIDIRSVEKAITPRTRVIIPVHLFGQCANMDGIMALAAAHDITVIEDAAQALSADYTNSQGKRHKAGTLSGLGITSFFPTKNLGCFGDGGAIITNNEELAGEMAAITHHGMHTQYHYDITGVNSRLDTMQAAILLVKLRYLDGYSAARQQAAAWYDRELSGAHGIAIPQRSAFSTHVYHQYTIRLNNINREGLRQHLGAKGIPSMVYYPIALHLQKAFKYLGCGAGDFPVAERLCETVLSLPMHTELDEEQVKAIAGAILEYVNP